MATKVPTATKVPMATKSTICTKSIKCPPRGLASYVIWACFVDNSAVTKKCEFVNNFCYHQVMNQTSVTSPE